MPTTTIPAGETAPQGLPLHSGDVQIVHGTADFVQVNAGADQIVDGGRTSGTTVSTGGQQFVVNGGFANNTGLYDARMTIDASSSTYYSVCNNGGYMEVSGRADMTIINEGGIQAVLAGATAANTLIGYKGTQIINGGSTIGTHLQPGGIIMLPGLIYQTDGQVRLDQSNDMLTITEGTSSYSLQLAGDYGGTTFQLTAADYNASSGTMLTALCFCRGTRLRTPNGGTMIERLRPGDAIVTANSTVRLVRWIGSSTAIVGPDDQPVIVRAGAFPDGSPHRDLRVTRGHSFVFGQVLIPIGALVNGNSICWDTDARWVEVFHVELDRHDILVAEGALAESYRDDGNRVGFATKSVGRAAAKSMPTRMPVVSSGPIVERTFRRLAERGRAARPIAAVSAAAGR